MDISAREDDERYKTTTIMHTTTTVRKFADYNTGETPAIPPQRARGGGVTALLGSAIKTQTAGMETSKLEDGSAKEAAATVTPSSELPEEPTILGHAQSSPEWYQRRGASKRGMGTTLSRGLGNGRPRQRQNRY